MIHMPLGPLPLCRANRRWVHTPAHLCSTRKVSSQKNVERTSAGSGSPVHALPPHRHGNTQFVHKAVTQTVCGYIHNNN